MSWTETPPKTWMVLYFLGALAPLALNFIIALSSPYGFWLSLLAGLSTLVLLYGATLPLAERRKDSHRLRDYGLELMDSRNPVIYGHGLLMVNMAMDYVRDGVWHKPGDYVWDDP